MDDRDKYSNGQTLEERLKDILHNPVDMSDYVPEEDFDINLDKEETSNDMFDCWLDNSRDWDDSDYGRDAWDAYYDRLGD